LILDLAADTPWRAAPSAPLVVGIGGSTFAGSTSERLLGAALAEAAKLGARTQLIAGPNLMLPFYAPAQTPREAAALALIAALRAADGVIIASPAYHGSISGMVKNALDYVEELRTDKRPYLEGRAVGCIACASGWQATGPVLAALRSITHALRGWPTPLGIGANASAGLFDGEGVCTDETVKTQLGVMADQIVTFATRPLMRR
jgi:FMN reductase